MLFQLFENVTGRHTCVSESKSFNGWRSPTVVLTPTPVRKSLPGYLYHIWKSNCCLVCPCHLFFVQIHIFRFLSVYIWHNDYFICMNTVPYVRNPCHSRPFSGSSRSPSSIVTLQSLEWQSTRFPATLSPLNFRCLALPCSLLQTYRLPWFCITSRLLPAMFCDIIFNTWQSERPV